MLLYVSARPIFTDDAWWHLAHGEAYLEQGPWLDADPLLFDAAGPPAPASWLFDAGLALAWKTTGFQGLRILHALAVLAIIVLAFRVLRRVSASVPLAACGTAVFAVLSAFRLFQLRPELVTIAATLALFDWLIAPRSGRYRLWSIALAAGLAALWANLHAGFLLAPILLAVAATGVCVALLMHGARTSNADWPRVRWLLAASAASTVGSLCNPSGFGALLPYLRSGDSTPTLALVYDEWAPLRLFQLPVPEISPSPLDWLLLWGLLGLTLGGTAWWASGIRSRDSTTHEIDPALIALSFASWIAMAIAIRFLWLAIFPILMLGQIVRIRATSSPRSTRMWGGWSALATALLIPGFLLWGMWPFLARGTPTSPDGYVAPYAMTKHPGHATWFLRDAGLTGSLFAPYASGGFLGFWLAPDLHVLVNGSLNVTPKILSTYLGLRERRGSEGQTFEETLASQNVDVFLGAGLPGYHPTRVRSFTSTHLERSEGWVLVFRSLRESVWLRDHPGNSNNFERVARYYANAGIDFDRIRGFDVAEVLREARDWSVRHSLAPVDLPALENSVATPSGRPRTDSLARLAGIRASLGQYSEALELDERLLSWSPRDRGALRRQLWCLLHLDRATEAVEVADRLARLPAPDALDHILYNTAQRYAEEPNPERRAAHAALIPLLTRVQASKLTRGYRPPPIRTDHRRIEEADAEQGRATLD